MAINDAGIAVGNAGSGTAAVFQNGEEPILQSRRNVEQAATAADASITPPNDADDFVGYWGNQPWVSFSPTGDAGSLLQPGSGRTVLTVAGINNRRQIVGTGYYRAGFGSVPRAFLLEPAPPARKTPAPYCGALTWSPQ